MKESAQRYPLSWPNGWKRTASHQRKRAAFHQTKTVYHTRNDGSQSAWKQKESLSVGSALGRLDSELRRLGARDVLLSSNLRVNLDGRPSAAQAKMLDDPGVACYFKLNGSPRVLACDKWLSAAENIAAVAGHIQAIRAQDRYGVGTLEQAFAGYAALPPTAADWWTVLGVSREATTEQIDTAFKALARKHHPDVGGDHAQMAKITEARRLALQSKQ